MEYIFQSGACATEKGRQFRQMSTDLSDFFPMTFCIEERVTVNCNVTGHKVKKDPFSLQFLLNGMTLD